LQALGLQFADIASQLLSIIPETLNYVNWYYLSDRLSEARTQSVAGRNKIEYYVEGEGL